MSLWRSDEFLLTLSLYMRYKLDSWNVAQFTVWVKKKKKKRTPRSNPKSLKIKKIHMVHWSFAMSQGWLLSNHFCKARQNCLRPSFALLWKLPQMPSCRANNANLDKNNFDMFYKIDWCAAIHGRIWINNVPNESSIIMLSCTDISFVISFFQFWV